MRLLLLLLLLVWLVWWLASRRRARNPGSSRRSTGQPRMDRDEAYRVLGLEPGASDDEIIAAHKRLMQRLHPDRGGSDLLASRVNAARRRLLDESDRG